MTDDTTPSFLSRWSRLKRRVSNEREAAARPETTAQPSPPNALPQSVETGPGSKPTGSPSASPEQTPAPEQGEVDVSKLPAIESLGRDSDYSVFMRRGVPDELRNKALRRMWLTDPSIAGPDLLEMNALDYTGLEGPRPLAPYGTQAVAAVAKAVRKHLAEARDESETRPEKQDSGASAEPQTSEQEPKPDDDDRRSS